VRIDDPGWQGGLAQGRADLRGRLNALAPGHPSSPDDAGGAARPREAGLGDLGVAEPLTDAEHAEHVAEVQDRLEKARADGLETFLQHTTDRDHVQWTEERTLQHDAIIADLYRLAAAVPCERRAILAGGLPGAGKTTVLARHAGIDRSRYLTVNPDDVKEEMARRGMIPGVPGLTPMEASDLAHEESSHIAKQLALRAMADGKNIIWDITMTSADSTARRIAELRQAGYGHIEGVFVDIPVEVSVRRADARHREGHDAFRAHSGTGGRFVAAETIRERSDPDYGSLPRRTFELSKHLLDAWRAFDNSADGRAPVPIDAGKREEER